jgi:hypothetical protein
MSQSLLKPGAFHLQQIQTGSMVKLSAGLVRADDGGDGPDEAVLSKPPD